MSYKNLVILCCGDTSIHKEWVKPNREFDVMIIYFGDITDKYLEDTDRGLYVSDKGHKWGLTSNAYNTHKELISRYDAVWCPDEDIRITSNDINRCFDIFHGNKLSLAQPSLYPLNSSHGITNTNHGNLLRYTNFVEIMAPMFSINAFEILSTTFNESVSGWGLDWAWPKILG